MMPAATSNARYIRLFVRRRRHTTTYAVNRLLPSRRRMAHIANYLLPGRAGYNRYTLVETLFICLDQAIKIGKVRSASFGDRHRR